MAASTIHALASKPKLPSHPDVLSTFLLVCGGGRRDGRRWTACWQKIVQGGEPNGVSAEAALVTAAAEVTNTSDLRLSELTDSALKAKLRMVQQQLVAAVTTMGILQKNLVAITEEINRRAEVE
jgi:hypothetical protein